MLGLSWAAVDLEARTVRVSQGVQRAGGRLVLDELKSERSHRTLPVPKVVVTALREHRVRQDRERLAAGRHWASNDLVFCTEYGTPIDPRNVNRSFRSLLIQAGVGVVLLNPGEDNPRYRTTVRLHDLRHCALRSYSPRACPPAW
jgi:integrase